MRPEGSGLKDTDKGDPARGRVTWGEVAKTGLAFEPCDDSLLNQNMGHVVLLWDEPAEINVARTERDHTRDRVDQDCEPLLSKGDEDVLRIAIADRLAEGIDPFRDANGGKRANKESMSRPKSMRNGRLRNTYRSSNIGHRRTRPAAEEDLTGSSENLFVGSCSGSGHGVTFIYESIH